MLVIYQVWFRSSLEFAAVVKFGTHITPGPGYFIVCMAHDVSEGAPLEKQLHDMRGLVHEGRRGDKVPAAGRQLSYHGVCSPLLWVKMMEGFQA